MTLSIFECVLNVFVFIFDMESPLLELFKHISSVVEIQILSVQLISATKHFKSPLIDKHAGSEKKNKVFISDKNKAK